MYGQATPHCLYNSPAYNEELFLKREGRSWREGGSEGDGREGVKGVGGSEGDGREGVKGMGGRE